VHETLSSSGFAISSLELVPAGHICTSCVTRRRRRSSWQQSYRPIRRSGAICRTIRDEARRRLEDPAWSKNLACVEARCTGTGRSHVRPDARKLQVRYDEGIAIHIDLEPCAVACEGGSDRLRARLYSLPPSQRRQHPGYESLRGSMAGLCAPLPTAILRLGHAFPVLSRARALLYRIPLGLRPSLLRLLCRLPSFVRRSLSYYGRV
jgi:hypothetical protein